MSGSRDPVGLGAALGLVASSAAVLLGLALAANLFRYGLAGFLGGIGLAVGGAWLAGRLLRP